MSIMNMKGDDDRWKNKEKRQERRGQKNNQQQHTKPKT